MALSHPWNLTPKDAIALQNQLRSQVIQVDQIRQPRRIAGVDVGFEQSGKVTRAAIAILDFPSLQLIDQAIARIPTQFPYIPGLLSFREVPAILQAIDKLSCVPELLLCDGQGLAHPRRFGLACHLGLLTDIPSIGVAKTRLIGKHEQLPEEKGSWVPLMDRDEIIGAVLRSRSGMKPIYVSIGHRISLDSALNYVLAATTRYKLPETTRAAHHLASVDKSAVTGRPESR
ncbi:MAG: deoxyribonuclease V [Candidatus Thiodiazotropha weberae]|uniref:Endonuclease V n=1 Tax=Candidatus Thiodiazotropha endoloripes TaxID=1818881 RepID=A0A1E2UN81_9GAMM|nr:deoxyribonuclease V [Candidatus Thiodiazotropha endoloripes]MCG7897167.1 deoxyribonuclease V [Candidatus Thiodiazotropha weberae]ODB96004.1 endonuclease V [Candidatus Thiodiazotropha endoloripes]